MTPRSDVEAANVAKQSLGCQGGGGPPDVSPGLAQTGIPLQGSGDSGRQATWPVDDYRLQWNAVFCTRCMLAGTPAPGLRAAPPWYGSPPLGSARSPVVGLPIPRVWRVLARFARVSAASPPTATENAPKRSIGRLPRQPPKRSNSSVTEAAADHRGNTERRPTARARERGDWLSPNRPQTDEGAESADAARAFQNTLGESQQSVW